RETLTLPAPERDRRLRDPAVRERMRRELADPTGRAVVFTWSEMAIEAVRDTERRPLVGRSIADLARARGADPLDFFLDLALSEDLTTQFELRRETSDHVREIIASQIREPIVTAGSSDAGAHLLSFVGADYTTRLLAEWVPEVLSLEAAVHRLTAAPARIHGIEGRGVIREGAAADLVVYDPARLAAGATRLVRDFPGGSPRLVVDAEGYVATIVNGEVLFEGGKPTGALPGRVVRGG
ncbi:MAG: amidohydrolase family protein, partial [Candidatus Binatia bacterium]